MCRLTYRQISVYNKNDRVSDFGDDNTELTFSKYKRLALQTATVMEHTETLSDKSIKLKVCGTYIAVLKDNGCVVSANFCRERFCPMCQKRKSLKQYAQCKTIADTMRGSYLFLHLVLTVRNCEGAALAGTIDKLYKASRLFFKTPKIERAFKGAARNLEVTYNAVDRSFHPHLHCLVAVLPSYPTSRYYLRFDTLQEIWRDCLQVDYLPTVNIKRCDENGFAEISKYCCKPLDLDLPLSEHAKVLDTLNVALKGRRLQQYFGVLKDVRQALSFADDDTEDTEKLQLTSDKLVYLIYNHRSQRYEKQ